MKTMLLCLGLILPGATAVKAEQTENRPSLSGLVKDADGRSVAKATVFIYTAGPKQGSSSICPSCYADCQKRAQTDESGRFQIEKLDPSLLFRLLVVAKDFESQFATKVDPTNGVQTVSLKPLNMDALKSSLRIKGMVMNEHGKPVAGAVISPEGVTTGEFTRWGGNESVVEPLAVSDDAGRFVLFCKSNSVLAVHAIAEGRGVSKLWVKLEPGNDHVIRMLDGVTVTGQILRDGKPAEGVTVSANTKDRECGKYYNCDPASTDSNGRFMLLNMPPGNDFMIYTSIKSSEGKGAVQPVLVTTKDSGAVQDLGNLKMLPGYKISGRVVLSDGKPLPEKTRITLGRESLSDSQEALIDKEGRFQFTDVTADSVSMFLGVKGYRLSKKNPSLDWYNGRIVGRMAGNIDDFVVLMEPGKWDHNNQEDLPGSDDNYPVEKPLRSIKL